MLRTFAEHVDLYATAADGAVMTAFLDGGGWREWSAIGSAKMMPGATVAAMQTFPGHVDVYATKADGSVMTAFFADGVWNDWFAIGALKLEAGAIVTASLP